MDLHPWGGHEVSVPPLPLDLGHEHEAPEGPVPLEGPQEHVDLPVPLELTHHLQKTYNIQICTIQIP